MVNEKQEQKIMERVQATIEVYFANDGLINDTDLANILTLSGIKTSSSTVGRDLVSTRAEQLIGTDRLEYIKKLRQKNKELGLSKGGKNSVFNNNIERDIDGKFKGSAPRRG